MRKFTYPVLERGLSEFANLPPSTIKVELCPPKIQSATGMTYAVDRLRTCGQRTSVQILYTAHQPPDEFDANDESKVFFWSPLLHGGLIDESINEILDNHVMKYPGDQQLIAGVWLNLFCLLAKERGGFYVLGTLDKESPYGIIVSCEGDMNRVRGTKGDKMPLWVPYERSIIQLVTAPISYRRFSMNGEVRIPSAVIEAYIHVEDLTGKNMDFKPSRELHTHPVLSLVPRGASGHNPYRTGMRAWGKGDGLAAVDRDVNLSEVILGPGKPKSDQEDASRYANSAPDFPGYVTGLDTGRDEGSFLTPLQTEEAEKDWTAWEDNDRITLGPKVVEDEGLNRVLFWTAVVLAGVCVGAVAPFLGRYLGIW
ncbi:MAG: hypothetical protein WCZ86_06135 [Desulfurivibrionaceae bacterium]